MKFSIITPSYNQGKYIKKTIDSVLAQNYRNYEHIIIDGKSTDNTIKILKSYGKKIRWISEKDKGQSDAINKGLKIAKGEIFACLCSDDYYLPNTLTKINNFFLMNKKAKWVTGDYKIVNGKGKDIQNYVVIYKRILRTCPNYQVLSLTNMIALPSTFWKREIFENVGYFKTNLHYAMDYDFWLRTIKKYPLFVVNDKLAAFRIHKLSKGGSRYIEQFKEDYLISKNYNKNKFINFLHLMHNTLIVTTYSLIK